MSAVKKKPKLSDLASAYVVKSTKRFAKGVPVDAYADNFVNGYTWGAHAGYMAGFKAAQRKGKS